MLGIEALNWHEWRAIILHKSSFNIFKSNVISIKNHCQSELNESVIALKKNTAVWEKDVERKAQKFLFCTFYAVPSHVIIDTIWLRLLMHKKCHILGNHIKLAKSCTILKIDTTSIDLKACYNNQFYLIFFINNECMTKWTYINPHVYNMKGF